jgi:hypothetical protein
MYIFPNKLFEIQSKSATLPAKINIWKSFSSSQFQAVPNFKCSQRYQQVITRNNFEPILWLVCRRVIWTHSNFIFKTWFLKKSMVRNRESDSLFHTVGFFRLHFFYAQFSEPTPATAVASSLKGIVGFGRRTYSTQARPVTRGSRGKLP